MDIGKSIVAFALVALGAGAGMTQGAPILPFSMGDPIDMGGSPVDSASDPNLMAEGNFAVVPEGVSNEQFIMIAGGGGGAGSDGLAAEPSTLFLFTWLLVGLAVLRRTVQVR